MQYQPTGTMMTLSAWLKRVGSGLVLLLVGPVLGAAAQPAPSVDQLMTAGRQAGVDLALMEQVVQRSERAGYTPDQTAQLLRPAVGLAQEQLPAAGVLQKALEGLAKQVPPPRIQPVLQRMHASTQQAGTLIGAWTQRPAVRAMMGRDHASALDPAARDQLIRSATQAQMQDVPAAVMQQLLDALPAQTKRRPVPPGEVAATMQVLPELMSHGASPQTTVELLTHVVDAGYGPSSVRQLPTAVQAARQQNQRPMEVLMRNAARAIAQGTPAADVLGRLFDGGVPGGPPGEVGGPPPNVPGQGKPPNTPPGNGPPGQGDGPPGQGGDPPGQGGDPPGQGGNSGG